MADDNGQPRSEAPTQRRRDDARRKGQVAISSDLSGGLLLLCGVAILWFFGGILGEGLLQSMRNGLVRLPFEELDERITTMQLALLLGNGLKLSGALMAGLFVIALGTALMQAGVTFSAEPLRPDLNRVSLTKGWSRLMSIRSVMRGLMAVLKIAAIGVLIGWILKGRIGSIALSGHGTLPQAALIAWSSSILAAIAVASSLVVIGLGDYVFQRWKHEEELRMTKQEVKEEQKQDEGDPQVRARIRKLQREMTQTRMINDVVTADAVITNPTHLAVALKYDRSTMAAPKVVAKGADALAHRIRKMAEEHSVPVLERKPLARALYSAVDVGQEIPIELYHAIAEILAYVYRLDRAAA